MPRGGGTGPGGGWRPPGGSGDAAAPLSPCTGVNIGGAGSYIYEKPQIEGQTAPGPIEHPAKVEERKVNAAPPKGPSKGEGWGARATGVLGWVLAGVSHTCVPLSSSLQRHHLHRGAQHVPTLRQEGLLW